MIIPNEYSDAAPYGYCRERCCEGKRHALVLNPRGAQGFIPAQDLLYCPVCKPELEVKVKS